MTVKNIWFSSDLHFGHKNIIQFCNRPFTTVKEMDEGLIENHNKLVKPGDTVYWIGDIFFYPDVQEKENIVSKLNGNIILVTGNHDRQLRRVMKFAEVHHRILELDTRSWAPYFPTLCHYPMMSWLKSDHGTFHLHGHTHGNLPFDPKVRRLDVGVDCWDYKPVHWDTIVAKLSAIPTPRELKTGHHQRPDNT